MTTRNKSILIITGTLLLGMVLGALVWSSIHTRRMQQIADLRSTDRLMAFIEQAVQPTDDAQRTAIRDVVQSHQTAVRGLMDQVREQQTALQGQLTEVLTPAQQERLTEAFGKRFNRKSGRDGKNRRGRRGHDWMKRDVNQDSVLSREEFLAPMLEMMNRLDTNRDGVLTQAELQAGRTKSAKE